MAFREIAKRLQYPEGLSQRYRTADALYRFLVGTLYDDARLSPFDQEFAGGSQGPYIKLRDRRPSVVSNFAQQFVEQAVGLLWMDEQFPVVRAYQAADPDEIDRDAELSVQHLVEALALDDVMARVTHLGAIGSVAIVVRALPAPDDGFPLIEVWRGYQCVPQFDAKNPTRLIGLTTVYPVTGERLALSGYKIPKDEHHETFWMRIDLDAQEETRYKPLREELFAMLGQKDRNGDVIEWKEDESFGHGFGCVPAVWAKAPNAAVSDLDGACVFGAAVDTIVELDYQLSQIGRAYKYTADPLLAIKRGELNVNSYDPSGSRPSQTQQDEHGNMIRSATNIIDIPANGDAKLLEISGSGLTAALDYVSRLREYALESIGGMKSDSETQKGAQSGRALEILYQALVLVVKRQRLAWGNKALLPLIHLLLQGITAGELVVPGMTPVDTDAVQLRLKWPTWMTPTGPDLLATAQGWQSLAGGSPTAPVAILPRESVTRLAATNLGFNDADALVAEIEKQTEEDAQAELEQADAQGAIEAKHAPKPAPKAKG